MFDSLTIDSNDDISIDNGTGQLTDDITTEDIEDTKEVLESIEEVIDEVTEDAESEEDKEDTDNGIEED